MATIYPFLQTVKYHDGGSDPRELPLYIDAKWNDEAGSAELNELDEPVMVSGTEAIRGWICRTLRTQRYAEELFSFDYGCEIYDIVGRGWSRETRLAEAERYIKDALLQNPYILSVDVTDLSFAGDTLTVSAVAHTIYEDITLEEINV